MVGATAAQARMTEVGEGEGEGAVSIVAWPGCIERGETDPAHDWMTKLEEATGCMFMEYSLRPNLQSDLSVWLGSVPAACSDGSGMQTQEGCDANGYQGFDRIRFWTTPTADCSQGEGACVPYCRWTSDYIGVIGGR